MLTEGGSCALEKTTNHLFEMCTADDLLIENVGGSNKVVLELKWTRHQLRARCCHCSVVASFAGGAPR